MGLSSPAYFSSASLALVLEDEAKLAQQEKEYNAQQQGQQAVCFLFFFEWLT